MQLASGTAKKRHVDFEDERRRTRGRKIVTVHIPTIFQSPSERTRGILDVLLANPVLVHELAPVYDQNSFADDPINAQRAEDLEALPRTHVGFPPGVPVGQNAAAPEVIIQYGPAESRAKVNCL